MTLGGEPVSDPATSWWVTVIVGIVCAAIPSVIAVAMKGKADERTERVRDELKGKSDEVARLSENLALERRTRFQKLHEARFDVMEEIAHMLAGVMRALHEAQDGCINYAATTAMHRNLYDKGNAFEEYKNKHQMLFPDHVANELDELNTILSRGSKIIYASLADGPEAFVRPDVFGPLAELDERIDALQKSFRKLYGVEDSTE